ncbi:MAG: U32 family peptidase [Pirellulales bacterium]
MYCDWEDIRRYRGAVELARAAGRTIGLATLRIVKPGEEGLLSIIGRAAPDRILIRNLAGLEYYRKQTPEIELRGDFSLNVVNPLSAALYRDQGLRRMTPGFDLNWEQLADLLGVADPDWFEPVVHQHMPMFHNEHCIFAAMLSTGKDWRDCGRPCDLHKVDLRDRSGAELPLLADTGCRNTVFNAVPQSAAEYLPRMLERGVRHFRIDLLRENAAETKDLLDQYAGALSGKTQARATFRSLRILNQLGVTRGTLEG